MSTIKVSTISPLGTDATKTITIGASGDVAAGVFTNVPAFEAYLSSRSQQKYNLIQRYMIQMALTTTLQIIVLLLV
jgi:hypothetical protein